MFSVFPPSVGSLRAPKEALRVLLVLRAALCSPWGRTPHTRVFIPGGPTTRVFSSLDEARGPHLALTPPRCFSRPRPHRDRPPPSPPPPPPRSRPMTRAPASFLPARPCLPLCPGGGADPTRCCPARSPPGPRRPLSEHRRPPRARSGRPRLPGGALRRMPPSPRGQGRKRRPPLHQARRAAAARSSATGRNGAAASGPGKPPGRRCLSPRPVPRPRLGHPRGGSRMEERPV